MQDMFMAVHDFTEPFIAHSLQTLGNSPCPHWLHQWEEQHRQELKHLAQNTEECIFWSEEEDRSTPEPTLQHLRSFFHTEIWQYLNCQKLPLPLAAVLYHSALSLPAKATENAPLKAVRLLQESCALVGDAHLDNYFPLKIDGLIGPKTVALAKDLHEYGLSYYTARHMVRQRLRFITQLAQKSAALSVTEEKKHCQALLEHLALLERDN